MYILAVLARVYQMAQLLIEMKENLWKNKLFFEFLNFFFTHYLDNTQIDLRCETSAIFILRVKKHLKCDLDAESP